jgi:hypothetical protein
MSSPRPTTYNPTVPSNNLSSTTSNKRRNESSFLDEDALFPTEGDGGADSGVDGTALERLALLTDVLIGETLGGVEERGVEGAGAAEVAATAVADPVNDGIVCDAGVTASLERAEAAFGAEDGGAAIVVSASPFFRKWKLFDDNFKRELVVEGELSPALFPKFYSKNVKNRTFFQRLLPIKCPKIQCNAQISRFGLRSGDLSPVRLSHPFLPSCSFLYVDDM